MCENISLSLPPKEITLIVTDECTAACPNCCFQCSPKKKNKIELNSVKAYIEEAVSFYKTLKLLIITGGECFLLGDELNEIVEFGTKQGLATRIITNGYWASSEVKARTEIQKLVKAGLKEINFSTGDEHQKFVPFNNVINGIIASIENRLIVAVNVEVSENSVFKESTIRQDPRLSRFSSHFDKDLIILSSKWVPFSEKRLEHKTTKSSNIKKYYFQPQTRCTSILKSIVISPGGNMIACCGLPVFNFKTLMLGNLNKYSVRDLYEYQFSDFLKIWLFTEGPKKILEFCYRERRLKIPKLDELHTCQICSKILSKKENLDCLKKNYKKVFVNILIKYEMLRKKEIKLTKIS